MDATVIVPLEADYESIARSAGAEPGTARYWNDGRVEVPGVSQAVLDAALAAYDHAGRMLAAARVAALAAIDGAAEAARLRNITPGGGQAMTYLRKEAQARAYVTAGYTGSVPALVQAKANAAGITVQHAADLIIATADAWEALAAQIEEAREGGKAAVGAAADVAAVVAARDATLAALAAL